MNDSGGARDGCARLAGTAFAAWLCCVLVCALASGFSASARAQSVAPVPVPSSAVPAEPSAQALAGVRERMLAHDDAGALAAIAALPTGLQDQSNVRYLSARLYERQNRYDVALASLPPQLTGLPSNVAADVVKRRALWLARGGNCTQARTLLVTLIKDSSDSELPLRAAECALSDGDVASALALLRDVHGKAASSFAIKLMLAKALRASGDNKAAAAELHALYVQKPEHSRIREVEAELKSLKEPLFLSDDDRLDRLEHLIDALRPEVALTELEHLKLAKTTGPKAAAISKARRARLLHLRGTALFKLRSRYGEAAKVLAQAAAAGGSDEASDAYNAARALARADHDAEAVKAYRAFAKRYPDSQFVSDALHDAAWLELRHDLAGGETHMRAFLADAEKLGQHEAAQSGLWELSFYLFDHNQPLKALPLFERYAATSDTAMIRARGLYWAARAAQLGGRHELALQHFREAIAVEPLHWYALLSAARLRELNEDPGLPFGTSLPAQAVLPLLAAQPQRASCQPAATPASVPSTPSTKDADVASAPTKPADKSPPTLPLGRSVLLALPDDVLFYRELGLYEDAVRALRSCEDALTPSDGDSYMALVAAYGDLQEVATPYRMVVRKYDGILRMTPDAGAKLLWQAIYPRPYAALVTTLTAQEKLPDDFVYSIMRQESAYDAGVVSSADAIGLLQLIEPTAKHMAGELGMTGFQRSMLYQPETNLRLGAHYLSDLLARFGGQAVPAIAAYNAGEHRIGPWLTRAASRNPTIELDRFVEDIPIDQTRNYVRRVVANWARYRYLADPSKGWPFDLPMTLQR